MKTVLLTGASGFVGSAVAELLIDSGKEVTALGRSAPKREMAYIRADLADGAGLQQALNGKKFDCIMHIASLPGDTGNPGEMLDVNVLGCHNLLEYARSSGTGRFVLAGSISAYEWYPSTKFNPPRDLPVNEEHPCRPKDMYATTKRMQELLAMTYYHQYGVPAVVLRLTAVVGPQGRGGSTVWGGFAKELAEGRKLRIPHLTAEEECHYVDVRDAARMFAAAGEHPGAIGEIFNCCGPKAVKGYELAEMAQSLVPGIEVEYGFPWSMAQGGRISFDMTKAERLMGFRMQYSMDDTVRNMLDRDNARSA